MPHTDSETGLGLDSFLVHLLPNERHGIVGRLCEALEISRSGYDRKRKRANFPSERDLERVADAFELIENGRRLTATDLKLRFGIITWEQVQEEMAQTTARMAELRKMAKEFPHPGVTATREGVKVGRRQSVHDDAVRGDAPPL